MNSRELTASVTAIACNLVADEINLLGMTFTRLGDTMSGICQCVVSESGSK